MQALPSITPFGVQNRGETYTCTVPYDMNALDIKAVAADPEATVTILNNVLVIGQTTTVSIKVQRAGHQRCIIPSWLRVPPVLEGGRVVPLPRLRIPPPPPISSRS